MDDGGSSHQHGAMTMSSNTLSNIPRITHSPRPERTRPSGKAQTPVTSPDPRAFGLTKAAYPIPEPLALLSIGRTSLYRLIERGQLRPVKLGKKTLLCADDLAAFLTRMKAAA